MLKKLKIFFYTILIFFLLFSFPILPAISSAKLVMLYVLVGVCLHGGFKRQVGLFHRRFHNFHIIYFLLFFYTSAETIFCFAFEWTLVGKVISSFIFYFVSLLFYEEVSKEIEVDTSVLYCFALQSIFIILAIFSESFYTLTAPFRAELSLNHEMAYGRLRGNAISGYQFFGIATMYSFVIIYLLLNFKKIKWNFFLLILFIVAAACSGRFSVVGIIIGLTILLIRYVVQGNFKRALWIVVCSAVTIFLIVFLLYNLVDEISDPMMYKVISAYLVAPIDSVIYGGEFQTSSTDGLLDMYEEDDIKKYFVWGAGRYSMPDGSYFGRVDIGYYRMLGYYGIIGFGVITYALYYLIYRTKSNLDIYTKHAFFINFLVLNIKGDVQVFNNNIVPLMVVFLFFCQSYVKCDKYLLCR